MKQLAMIGVLMAVSTAPAAATADPAPAPAMERLGVYVVAEDLERSAAFYEALFGKPPQVRTPGLVGFDVAGGLYAVVSKGAYAPGATLGGNVAPYIRVGDIDAWFDRLRRVAPERLVTSSVLREGPISLIKFTDTDGNLVEMFSITAPPAIRP